MDKYHIFLLFMHTTLLRSSPSKFATVRISNECVIFNIMSPSETKVSNLEQATVMEQLSVILYRKELIAIPAYESKTYSKEPHSVPSR